MDPEPQTTNIYSQEPTMLDENSHQSSSSNQEEDLLFLAKICESRFPVYVVQAEGELLAAKVYMKGEQGKHPYFLREKELHNFSHPNIAFPKYVIEDKVFHTEQYDFTASLALSEFCSHGDFYNLVVENQVPLNETVLRTYFH